MAGDIFLALQPADGRSGNGLVALLGGDVITTQSIRKRGVINANFGKMFVDLMLDHGGHLRTVIGVQRVESLFTLYVLFKSEQPFLYDELKRGHIPKMVGTHALQYLVVDNLEFMEWDIPPQVNR